MTKRAISLILILLVVLPTVAVAAAVVFAPETPFAIFDSARSAALSAAVSEKAPKGGEAAETLPDSGRYIVKFKDGVPLSEIEKALGAVSYHPLAEAEQRLFAVATKGGSFLESQKDIIDYAEPDLERAVLSATDDPITVPAHKKLGLDIVRDTVAASSDVIVAVLDTGVDRTHEDLAGATILAGYDSVAKKAGVFGDEAGHGTGIIGIIAAVSDNKRGIAGAASGVTILPVKVSSSGEVIYSSDLISGIRFAADAGAKIINMSVGGYSSSYAEQDAVNYAVSKGCILIAAAGNGGDRSYGDQKSYPASYEGVISVASCDDNGNRSDFSQYNDAVDVAAPGENIAMPYCEDGRSVYRTDSGTSYSCAFVSAVAALTASYIGNEARFNGEEFLSLIIETCGKSRSDELGYGIINAEKIIAIAKKPIITGVVGGGLYSGSVNIGFNRGSATLDGEPFEDGDAVVANGIHILTVTDGETVKTIRFRLDYDPLSVDFKEFSAFAYFKFERGRAFLNGFPYTSGTRITASGRQHFVLTDGDERIEREVYLGYSLPTVFGIKDGGNYDRPVSIKIIGNGKAELDGKTVADKLTVLKNGSHTLTVFSENGALSKEYRFKVDFPYGTLTSGDYAGAKAAIDEENGYICIYGDTLTGIRIYNIETPNSYLHFIRTGTVYSHRFIGDKLVLLGEAGVTVVDRKRALSGAECVEKTISAEGMYYYAFGGDEIYCFGNEMIHRFDAENGNATPIFGLGFDCEVALYSNGRFCLAAPDFDSVVRIFDCESGEMTLFEPSIPFEHEPFFFKDGCLAIGGTIVNTENGEIILETASDSVVSINDSQVITESAVIDINSGRELAWLPFEVCHIAETEKALYLFGWNREIAVIDRAAGGIYAYGASESIYNSVSALETVNEYRVNAFYGKNKTAFAASASENTVYYLLSGENALFSLDALTLAEQATVPLRFVPSAVTASGGYVTVCFANAPFVYIASDTDLAGGRYISTPAKCDSAFVDGGVLIAASGGYLVHGPLGGAALKVTDIRADQVAIGSNRYAVTYRNSLSVYDLLFKRVVTAATSGGRLCFGNKISVGKRLYNRDLTAEPDADSEILALYGDIAITANGVFDASVGETIGYLAVKKATAAAICKNNALAAFGNGIVTVCSFKDGTPVNADPEIGNIADGNVYTDSAVITFEHGMGFLDGAQFASGNSVSEAGEHIFTVALPCGRSVDVEFSVAARLSAIEFLGGDRTMSVGENITLRIKYLPEGASSLPVTFICESDGISVAPSGVVTALAVGSYPITAKVDTEDGVISASCTVTVRNDLIAFSPESGITVDRDNAFAVGIPSGTSVDALKKMLIAESDIAVYDSHGNRVKNHVSTGNEIVLSSPDGTATDRLIAVIIGDTDGDGYISAYDIYILEQILENKRFDPAFIAAADINRNGVLADNDLRALKNAILLKDPIASAEPAYNLFGVCSVQTVSQTESGEIIDVVVCLSGCKYAKAVSGVIEYGEGLEFIEGKSAGWRVSANNLGNAVSFYAYGKNGEDCGKAFKVIINLRFRVTAKAGESVALASKAFTASFGSDCRLIRFENSEISVKSAELGEFSFDIKNAHSFEFNPKKTEYSVTIPYDSALADISFVRQENQTVHADGVVIPDSGESIVNITCADSDGSTRYYTVTVKRESEPRFETDCRLSALEVEGFRLSPSFSPDRFEYDITVPCGTQKISLYYTAQSKTAQIIVRGAEINGESGAVTLTVISPDGESLVYTINVTVLPQEAEPIESSETEAPTRENGFKSWMIFAAIGLLAVAAAVIVLYIRLAKRDEEIKASAENNTKDA